jgi:uncharacterized protein YidB (DUF937 family)
MRGTIMANPFLGQILGSVLGQARGRAQSGPGGGLSGGMGGMGDGRSALLAMLLPLAMQWVQRNGGVGQVLQRMGQRGYGRQVDSWVGTGANEPLDTGAVDDVVGHDEVMRLSQQLGVPEQDVKEGFAEILPEMVDQLSPEGRLPPDANQVLDAGQSTLSGMLAGLGRR